MALVFKCVLSSIYPIKCVDQRCLHLVFPSLVNFSLSIEHKWLKIHTYQLTHLYSTRYYWLVQNFSQRFTETFIDPLYLHGCSSTYSCKHVVIIKVKVFRLQNIAPKWVHRTTLQCCIASGRSVPINHNATKPCEARGWVRGEVRSRHSSRVDTFIFLPRKESLDQIGNSIINLTNGLAPLFHNTKHIKINCQAYKAFIASLITHTNK